MFVIDDIILAPAKAFMWLVRELANAAEQEQANERDTLMRQLQSLHMKLETGAIDQDAFDEEEQSILDRLDALAGETDDEPQDDLDDEPDDDTPDDEDEQDDDEAEIDDSADDDTPDEEGEDDDTIPRG